MKSKLTAGQIEEGAVNGGDPKVGGASVKQHSEGLRRGTNADRAIVLSLRRQTLTENIDICCETTRSTSNKLKDIFHSRGVTETLAGMHISNKHLVRPVTLNGASIQGST